MSDFLSGRYRGTGNSRRITGCRWQAGNVCGHEPGRPANTARNNIPTCSFFPQMVRIVFVPVYSPWKQSGQEDDGQQHDHRRPLNAAAVPSPKNGIIPSGTEKISARPPVHASSPNRKCRIPAQVPVLNLVLSSCTRQREALPDRYRSRRGSRPSRRADQLAGFHSEFAAKTKKIS